MAQITRIALVTDFGSSGPYSGQMILRLGHLAPDVSAVDLISDLAPFRPDLAAYLLPALVRNVPGVTLFVCVVDPGVGSERDAIAVEADGRWYLGPDNGLLSAVVRRASDARVLRIEWRPDRLSDSFHGRDLFCPLAAMLCRGELPDSVPIDSGAIVGADWPDDLARVVYADRYGNLITGIRASAVSRRAAVRIGGLDVFYARTFCEVPPGEVFWYENSFGLVELAVNRGRAELVLGLVPGDPIDLLPSQT